MHSVVMDSSKLAGEPDFPMLDVPRCGWQQFKQLDASEVSDRCWRADIVISVATPIPRDTIENAFKLQLIIAEGDNTDHIDLDAARTRGVTVCNTPGLHPVNREHTVKICNQVINNIDAWLKKQPVNTIT